jgi:tetratricopeptide (TPR) repeat protein
MKKETTSAQTLYEEAKKLFYKSDFLETLKLVNNIEKENLYSPDLKMKFLNLKGQTYLHLGDFKLAEENLLASLSIAQESGDRQSIAIRHENLATLYNVFKEYSKAIRSIQKAIELKGESGNPTDIARLLIQLSSLEFSIENTPSGITTLKKAAILIHHHELKNLYAALHFNTASQFKREKKYTAALREYSKCIKYAQTHQEDNVTTRAYNNLGDIYIQTGEWQKARKEFTECIKFARIANIPSFVITSTIQLGRIAFELGDIKEAKRIFDEVNAGAHESDDIMLHRDLAELGVMIYEAEGDYQSALASHRKYVAYYKKFYDNELSRAVLDMQAKYESEKSERELQKANLRQVESELKALRAQMDPHFIFNALSSMRREILEGNLENADKYLVRFSKLLRMILDTTRKPLVRLSDNIELLHLYIQIENSRQGNRFDYDISARGIDTAAINIPGLVLQPLAENAIVHGLNPKKKGRGKLSIVFSKSGKVLKVKVIDNGVGRSASGKNADDSHTSHAMNIIRETLSLIWKDKMPKNAFAIKDLKDKNNFNKGTEVTVLLPLSS